MRKALTEALKYLPAELRKTLTYDRGREMSEHKILEEDLGIDVYFCDPHSPWQKGTCENMNGLIRQYLPKEGANKQVISSQADSLIKISRIWADFFPANTSNQPI